MVPKGPLFVVAQSLALAAVDGPRGFAFGFLLTPMISVASPAESRNHHQSANSLGRLKRLICSLRDLLHVRLDRVAERGHGDAWLAVEEDTAKLALERANRVGQRRLRNPAALGGAGEVAFLAQR